MDFATVLAYIMPFVTTILYLIIFLVMVIPGGWYFMIYLNRRRWTANIWERRGNTAIITDRDVVVEERIKGKSAHIYRLRKKKYEVQPVAEDFVITFNKKNYVDYLRVGSDYIPFKHHFNFNDEGAEHVYKTMPYDVQMQMLSLDKLTDEIFKGKADFWSKYGLIAGFALIIVLLIILMSMYFDFVSSSIEPVKEATGALQNIASQLIGN